MSVDTDARYADDYKEIFVTRVVGGWRGGYFEYDLTSELSDFLDPIKTAEINFNKTKLKRIIHVKVIFPPVDFKDTVQLFESQLTEYEKVLGRIPSSKEIADKQKVDRDQ